MSSGLQTLNWAVLVCSVLKTYSYSSSTRVTDISNYSFYTWIYVFKLSFRHEHSAALGVFSHSCCMQMHTLGTSLQPSSWTVYSCGKKSIQHAIKGIMVATALLLVNSTVFSRSPHYGGSGLVMRDKGRKQHTCWLRSSERWEREKKKGEDGMNGWQYTMNSAVMLSTYYKYGCHPQKCFLNRRLQSSKARTSTGPNLSLKSCARLRPSYLIILIPSQVRIVIFQQIKQWCQKG